jgi:hypothetical protein
MDDSGVDHKSDCMDVCDSAIRRSLLLIAIVRVSRWMACKIGRYEKMQGCDMVVHENVGRSRMVVARGSSSRHSRVAWCGVVAFIGMPGAETLVLGPHRVFAVALPDGVP